MLLHILIFYHCTGYISHVVSLMHLHYHVEWAKSLHPVKLHT